MRLWRVPATRMRSAGRLSQPRLPAFLFQVTPADPWAYVGVATLVGAVGLGAAFLPARRAARTDPMITLRA